MLAVSVPLGNQCVYTSSVIFQKIVTDEHVLKMIQNSVESEAASDNDGDTAPEEDGSLTFEPKMTRSKVKDFIQKQGSVCCLHMVTNKCLREKTYSLGFPGCTVTENS